VETADVSTTVESDRFLAVERSMTWGATPSTIYGSHAESAAASPSTTWFLAEGSTVLDFDLFYLLQNRSRPRPTPPFATCSRRARRSRAPTTWRPAAAPPST
jgi:hypothetical protein